jgi:hypothetical protein
MIMPSMTVSRVRVIVIVMFVGIVLLGHVIDPRR